MTRSLFFIFVPLILLAMFQPEHSIASVDICGKLDDKNLSRETKEVLKNFCCFYFYLYPGDQFQSCQQRDSKYYCCTDDKEVMEIWRNMTLEKFKRKSSFILEDLEDLEITDKDDLEIKEEINRRLTEIALFKIAEQIEEKDCEENVRKILREFDYEDSEELARELCLLREKIESLKEILRKKGIEVICIDLEEGEMSLSSSLKEMIGEVCEELNKTKVKLEEERRKTVTLLLVLPILLSLAIVTLYYFFSQQGGISFAPTASALAKGVELREIYRGSEYRKIVDEVEPQVIKALIGVEGNVNPRKKISGFNVSMASDLGRVRELDEDSLACIMVSNGIRRGLFALADGMGGHNAGEVASKIAVETSMRRCLNLLFSMDGLDQRRIIESMSASFREAHSAILREAKSDPSKAGMGTTLDLLLLDVDRGVIYFSHIGDSRIYLLNPRKGYMRRLTRDHTLLREYAEKYGISEEEASKYVSRSVLTKALGVEGIDVTPDQRSFGVSEGDVILMCCDGLTDEVDEETIYRIILEEEDLERCARRLIQEANSRGGRDNISLILIGV